jgi:putative flippase GtrA
MLITAKRIKGLVIYGLIAVTGVTINLAMRVVFDDWMGLGFTTSVALGYFCGMIWGFVMTKLFGSTHLDSHFF